MQERSSVPKKSLFGVDFGLAAIHSFDPFFENDVDLAIIVNSTHFRSCHYQFLVACTRWSKHMWLQHKRLMSWSWKIRDIGWTPLREDMADMMASISMITHKLRILFKSLVYFVIKKKKHFFTILVSLEP